MDKISQLIKLARPIHWTKNFSLFAAVFLAGLLFEKGAFTNVVWAFFAFSFISSASYIINDVFDAKLDRLHPKKKFRPIASGRVSIVEALSLALVLVLVSFFIAVSLHQLFFFIIAGYFVIQILYSMGLKNIAIVDILIIASGFIMRIYAGALIVDAHLSVWFLLCVVSTALFLASGKRRAELNVTQETKTETRKSLRNYKKELLNSYVTMFGNASWMSWSLFTFFESPKAATPVWLLLAELSKTTTVNKLLMATIPIAIFGIMRYEALIFQGDSETPERLLLTDKSLILALTMWATLVYFILYSGVSVVGI